MSIVINYKKSSSKNKLGNLIFFVDEKYSLTSLKKYFTKSENETIRNILNSQNLSKKIVSFHLSSKTKIFLISFKKNIDLFEVENLGAEFFNYSKDLNQKNFYINSDLMQKNLRNLLIYFLHGFKLKSYVFEKYKTKKQKKNISINVIGISIPTIQDRIKFR